GESAVGAEQPDADTAVAGARTRLARRAGQEGARRIPERAAETAGSAGSAAGSAAGRPCLEPRVLERIDPLAPQRHVARLIAMHRDAAEPLQLGRPAQPPLPSPR